MISLPYIPKIMAQNSLKDKSTGRVS